MPNYIDPAITPVKFTDLPQEYARFRDSFEVDLENVLRSGQYIGGNYVTQFEDAISQLLFWECGQKVYTVGVNSGTTALYLCLKYLKEVIGHQDVIHTTPTSFWATTEAIVGAGFVPSYKDVNDKLQIDVTEDFTVAVGLHGHRVPEDYSSKYVIEDNAQCAPYHYNDNCWAATYSLFPSKPLGTCTDGGYICTKDENLYKWLKRAVYHGLDLSSDNRYLATMSTGTFRLTEIPALYALKKLQVLHDFQDQREKVAKDYCENLSLPFYEDSYYHVMNVNVHNKQDVVSTLKENGIQHNFHYPFTLIEQCENAGVRYSVERKHGKDIPVAEHHARTCLSLPLHPFLTADEVERVCDLVDGACVSA